MSQASTAAIFLTCYCKANWPNDINAMAKIVGPDYADKFVGYRGYASHKYLHDQDEIHKALDLEDGRGIFGFASYEDGSRLLFSCFDGLFTVDEHGLRRYDK